MYWQIFFSVFLFIIVQRVFLKSWHVLSWPQFWTRLSLLDPHNLKVKWQDVDCVLDGRAFNKTRVTSNGLIFERRLLWLLFFLCFAVPSVENSLCEFIYLDSFRSELAFKIWQLSVLHGEGSARKRIFTMFGGEQSPAAGRQLLIFLIDVLLLTWIIKAVPFLGFYRRN
jgi:hypothetical protein